MIAKNYKQLSKMAHPDVKRTEEGKEEAKHYSQLLNTAYQILKDEYEKAK